MTEVRGGGGDRSGTGTARRYRGPDRRARADAAFVGAPPAGVVPVCVLVCVGAGLPALFLIPRQADSAMVNAYFLVAGGLLAVVAGVAALLSWRVLGRAFEGWFGTGLVAFGVLTLFKSGLTEFGATGGRAALAFGPLVIAVIAGGLVWRAVTDAQVNAAFRPPVTLAAAIGGGVTTLGLLQLLSSHHGVPAWSAGSNGHLASICASAALWLAIALVSIRQARQRQGVPNWVACIVALIGLSAVVRAASLVSDWPAVPASVVAYLSTSLALGWAICRIQTVLRLGDRRDLRLHDALVAGRRQALTQREQMEEWMHDLRNSVAGLQAADAVLRSGSDEDIAVRQVLAGAVTAELARLHLLVAPARPLHVVEIGLSETLSPVIVAARARGSHITAELGDHHVRADPQALTQVVQNLLENCRRYAPASPIELRAASRGPTVEITVSDQGPGIPRAERHDVFSRGVRGRASQGTDGSGLGLFVSRNLLGAMGGTIHLAPDQAHGCRVVVTLPAANVPGQTGETHNGRGQRAAPRRHRLQSAS